MHASVHMHLHLYICNCICACVQAFARVCISTCARYQQRVCNRIYAKYPHTCVPYLMRARVSSRISIHNHPTCVPRPFPPHPQTRRPLPRQRRTVHRIRRGLTFSSRHPRRWNRTHSRRVASAPPLSRRFLASVVGPSCGTGSSSAARSRGESVAERVHVQHRSRYGGAATHGSGLVDKGGVVPC